jgi:Rod binding domain-containing protein
MNGLTTLAPVATAVNAPAAMPPAVATAPAPSAKFAGQAKMHHAAQQFEAMFMGEMLRMAHPASKASGVFAPGAGEKAWQGFMDQALGQAFAATGHTGLTSVIEQALNTAAKQAQGSAK